MITVGGASADGDKTDGVFDDFGVALALLGRFFGVSDAAGVFDDALGVRFTLDLVALVGASGGFSKRSEIILMNLSQSIDFSPSRLTPVTAMLTGRVLRTGVVLLVTRPELVVEVDIALPGRDVDKLFGVISPDRNPKDEESLNCVKKLFRNLLIKVLLDLVSEVIF